MEVVRRYPVLKAVTGVEVIYDGRFFAARNQVEGRTCGHRHPHYLDAHGCALDLWRRPA